MMASCLLGNLEQILMKFFNENTIENLSKRMNENAICKMVAILFQPQYVKGYLLVPLFLTWINFNPSMDKWSHAY